MRWTITLSNQGDKAVVRVRLKGLVGDVQESGEYDEKKFKNRVMYYLRPRRISSLVSPIAINQF